MGVFRLFRHLSKRYPNCINNFKDPNKYVKRGEPRQIINHEWSTDATLIDCNSIIHPVCQDVFEYGGKEKKSFFLTNKKKAMSMEELEKMAFNMFCNKLERIIEITKPKKIIYLAFDGTVPLAKQMQQRERRYRSSMNKSQNQFGFNPNCITIGTKFMDDLCKYVYFFIKKKKNYEWKNFTVYLSGVDVSAEGEHKIIRFLEETKLNSATIVSPDGDLIMLCMTLSISNVYIFRENVFNDTDADYFFVDVKELKNEVIKDIYCESLEYPFDKKASLRDYVLFTFLLGNDFIKHTCIEIPNQGVDILYKCYLDACTDKGNLIKEIGKKIVFRKESITELFKNLSQLEVKILLDRYENVKVKYPDRILNKNIIISKEGYKLNFESYRKEYYIEKLKVDPEYLEEGIDNICKCYMKTLLFIAIYYFKGVPTFSYMYPYSYSPLIYDIYKYCLKSKLEFTFDIDRPLSKYEALLGILPLSDFYLLPASVKESLETKLTMDPDFNCEVIIDRDGIIQEYEERIILPVVSYEKIKTIFEKVTLSEDEKKKNQFGFVYKF